MLKHHAGEKISIVYKESVEPNTSYMKKYVVSEELVGLVKDINHRNLTLKVISMDRAAMNFEVVWRKDWVVDSICYLRLKYNKKFNAQLCNSIHPMEEMYFIITDAIWEKNNERLKLIIGLA